MPLGKESVDIIQYAPFTSFVHPSFWNKLKDLKLDVDKLCETKKQVFGRYTYRDTIGTVFEVDGTSFNQTPETGQQFYLNIEGTIMNKNTLEEFKSIDKAALLNAIGQTLWANVEHNIWIERPSTLLTFIILSFADLKKFNYYYWFAFPAPSQPTLHTKEAKNLSTEFNNKQIEELTQQFTDLDMSQKYFFFALRENDNLVLRTLSDIAKSNMLQNDLNNMYFVFADPSSGENPGWPLRLFMAAMLKTCPHLADSELKVIGLRVDKTGAISNSRLFTVITKDVQPVESAGWVGWERNDKGNFGPRLANMSASMDPRIMASDQADLNIKLMKWRLVPELDVSIMGKTSCLLLGAGTLGCQVARNLLAWGFRNLTFIDNGKVSFSNPTRQCLYNYSDACHNRMKAEAAAAAVVNILPAVTSKGIVAHIPMPGHPVGESLKKETVSFVKTIIEAVEQHDVIFLLLDTREARWLPTLVAAHYGKIVINAALGFDSYLVMRHGVNGGLPQEGASSVHSTSVPGSQLGCYFCNDITAPGDSMKDRTLDQQCTVTRPGAAAVAGALAVELLVAMLQHPLKGQAPALYNFKTEDTIPSDLQGVLGPIPHSLRGFLHNYQTVAPTCTKFVQCIACSDVVIKQYRDEGIEFLLKVFNSGKYLEELTGLSELHLAAEITDLMALSDEED